jgi:outer membrane protein TolC
MYYWDQPYASARSGSAKREAAPVVNPALPQSHEPITLGEVIDVTLRNNTQTRQSWALAREAAALYAQSEQNFFPQATASYALTRSRGLLGVGLIPDPTNTGTPLPTAQVGYMSQWGPQLALSYLIFDFGATRLSSQSAFHTLYNANLTHNRMLDTVIQNVTTEYYAYLYEKKLLVAYRDDIADAQVTLSAAGESLHAGIKTVVDVLQARAQLLQLETERVQQEQVVKTAYAALLTNMGIPAHLDLLFAEMPDHPAVYSVMSTVHELIQSALKTRSDLLAAQEELQSKEKAVQAAFANMLPNFNTTFDLGRTNYSGQITDQYDFTWTIGLSWPLFSGFYNLNVARQAKAAALYSSASLHALELDMIEQITTSHHNIAIARDALRYTEEYLKTAQQEHQTALAQYKTGVTTILTVTNAQANLADARAKKANALRQWFVALSTLSYATGNRM